MAEPVVVRLADIRAVDTETVGGKGANLGELIAAGFAVPDGFVLTTAAYHAAARAAKVDPARPDDAAERLRSTAVPRRIGEAALKAYDALGAGGVAVRSSATAEDLPGASFAGQQDTYLGVEGPDSLLDAIRRCWASLWNERAVAYRAANGVDDGSVALAVVVQRMVDARAAGVLFTADPITGRRHTAIIDAIPGLGEALVSGAVVPDHFVADPETGRITERTSQGPEPVLTDRLIRELANVGERIEGALGSPQDIEFAIDRDDRVAIVQSRPITTLYPLPAGGAPPDGVLFSISVAQGYFDPITPMGMEAFLAIGRRVGITFTDPADAANAPNPVIAAGERPFVDVQSVLRDPVGRELLARLASAGEARSSVVFKKLAADPRYRGGRRSPLGTVRRVLPLLLRSQVPISILRLLQSPGKARARMLRRVDAMTRLDVRPGMTAAERLDLVESVMDDVLPFMFPRLIGLVAAGMLSYIAAGRLLGERATPDELLTLTRGLPHNPTTEMDLALWALARQIRDDPKAAALMRTRSQGEIAEAFQAGRAPAVVQTGLTSFLHRYGFRSVGEIDLGVPRWSEDPTHLIGAISNYLQLTDDALAPDAQFERGAREAEAMRATLLARVSGPRRRLLRFFLGRARALMGSREMPKYMLIGRVFTPVRQVLRPVGDELVSAGRLERPDDIYFLTLTQARAAVSGEDMRETVAANRATYDRERTRRRIPRVLLADGTDAEVALVETAEGDLRGSPASPGTVTGTARVIHSPRGAQLEPGEILVAPSTDPGWTPLFLTAGGLVMEMGGMMSHGAVVAREYGIPAVVGVPDATTRIATGDTITVDGSTGVVTTP